MNFVKYFTLACCLLFLGTACEKEKLNNDEDVNQALILDYLSGLDYDLDKVEFKDGFVVYESDAGWNMEDLLESIKAGEEIPSLDDDPDAAEFLIAEERQRGISDAQNTITRSNVANITYYIRGSVTSDLNVDWRNAIVDAANNWTNLSYCRINFNRVYASASADIVIGSDNDTYFPVDYLNQTNGEVVALGTYPVNGAPGRYIVINDFYADYYKKLEVAMHEFGHCLGFRHTGVDEGIHVHGTPVGENNSIMDTDGGNLPLKYGDERMARLFYPSSLPTPVGFSATRNSSGVVRIGYFNLAHFTRPYYWVRAAKYNTSGQILAVRYFKSRTIFPHGYHIFDWGGHQPGTYLFALRGCNYRKDTWSSRTSQVAVNL